MIFEHLCPGLRIVSFSTYFCPFNTIVTLGPSMEMNANPCRNKGLQLCIPSEDWGLGLYLSKQWVLKYPDIHFWGWMLYPNLFGLQNLCIWLTTFGFSWAGIRTLSEVLIQWSVIYSEAPMDIHGGSSVIKASWLVLERNRGIQYVPRSVSNILIYSASEVRWLHLSTTHSIWGFCSAKVLRGVQW